MKKFKNFIENKNIIYEDETGYISGYLRKDGYYWISEFVIYPEFRGKNNARKLASNLPQKCKLLAIPLHNMPGNKLSVDNLVNFYLSLGFEKIKDQYENIIMQRD